MASAPITLEAVSEPSGLPDFSSAMGSTIIHSNIDKIVGGVSGVGAWRATNAVASQSSVVCIGDRGYANSVCNELEFVPFKRQG